VPFGTASANQARNIGPAAAASAADEPISVNIETR
jgi:hypothetical protein